jgi:5-methylcytosine-specific restriction endonuclease McrA
MPIHNVLDLVDAITRGVFDPYSGQMNLFGKIEEHEPRYDGVPRRVLERHFGSLSAKDRRSALAFFPTCVLCGETRNPTLDHVRPLVNGHSLRPGNVVRLGRSCNSSKGDSSLEQLPGNEARLIIEAAASFLSNHEAGFLPFGFAGV